jgi:hypothetical protein
MSENVAGSTSRNPKGPHGLYRDNLTYLTVNIYSMGIAIIVTGVISVLIEISPGTGEYNFFVLKYRVT